jgi:hypothetical protein
MARPMPPEAPVTTAVWPTRQKGVELLAEGVFTRFGSHVLST